MKQVHFRDKVRVICKGAKRVDGSMDDDTWDKAPAAIKNRDQQKTDCDGKDDLAQIVYQIHTAAVEQINDMSDTESHTGNHNGRFDIILCDGNKQKPSENDFLYYVSGLSTKEILAAANIKESTLKYHNSHIYEKLNVKSRKELLVYISLMNRSKKEKDGSDPPLA